MGLLLLMLLFVVVVVIVGIVSILFIGGTYRNHLEQVLQ
jgi:hypothetical protein